MNRIRTLAAVVAALTVGGCAAPAPAPPRAAAVAHALGVAEVPADPARVVALTAGDADAALAVGITPVAVIAPFYAPDGRLPWQPADAATTVIPGNPDFSIDVERVAAADPDLVLGTGAALTEESYGRLAGLGVPVVAHLRDPLSDTWQERMTLVGDALSRPAEAAAAVAETEAAIADTAARHPGLAGRTFTFSVVQSPSALGTLVSSQDYLSVLLGEFGMRLAPSLAAVPEAAPGTGIAVLSTEQLSQLAADLVLVTYPAPGLREQLEADPRLAGLPGYRGFDLVTATALRTPSALSLRWGLAQLDEVLGTVADG